jgi:hypothetical protein
MDKNFGVCLRNERVAVRRQIAAQLAIVVNLSVEDNLKGPVSVGERLMPSGRQIQNGEPPVAQQDLRMLVKSFVIRTAVGLRSRYAAKSFNLLGGDAALKAIEA